MEISPPKRTKQRRASMVHVPMPSRLPRASTSFARNSTFDTTMTGAGTSTVPTTTSMTEERRAEELVQMQR